MRLATIRTPGGPRVHVRGASGYVDVARELEDESLADMIALLAAGDGVWERVRGLASKSGRELAETDFAPPVPRPGKILCLGRNYSEHAIETGYEPRSWPEIFARYATSITGPFDDMVKPALSNSFDYEGELGVVMRRGGRYIPREQALDAVAGCFVLNEGSVRDWQYASQQFTAGKNFDRTCPMGPEIVTTDEVDPSDLAIETRLNGELLQSGRTSHMIVNVPRIVEFVSSFLTLEPGDVIATGTPAGVGHVRKPPIFMAAGDLVEVTVEGVGTIRNRVVEEIGAPVASWSWAPEGVA